MALIDKASLLMVPSTYEAGTLYNVLPSGNRAPDETGSNSGYDQTRADFTFDRGTNAAATRVNADGLIEKYRENLLVQSNQFDTTWTAANVTITSGQSGYDDSSNAWLFNSSGGYIYQSGLGSVSGVHTLSVYVKAGTAQGFRIRVDQATDANYIIDLSDSSLISESGNITYKSTSVGTGWYRIEMAFVANTITNIQFRVTDLAGATASGTAYIMNAQLESGLVSTDYLDSGATTAKAGVLVDLPRINYDANGENGALLLEPSRSNSVPYSEGGFAYQTSTSGTGVTPVITENAATSPEGVQNAFRVDLNRGAGNTSSDWSWIYQNNVTYYNGDNRVSVYLKAATSSDIGKEVFVRVASDGQAVTLTEDWKRHDFNRPTTGVTSDAGLYTRGGSSADNEVSCFVYGFQVEQNASYPTSYIPNHGTSGGVTRAADSCSVTGVSDVIGQTEGTLFVEFTIDADNTDGYNRIFALSDNTSNNRIVLFAQNTEKLRAYVSNGGVQQANIISSQSVLGSHKAAFAYKANDFALYMDGAQIGTDNSGSVPACPNVYLGTEENAGAGDELGGSIKKATLFNERLSNAELAALTA
jgi:hypothetical protein